MSEGKTVIESVLREDRKFDPPAKFASAAHVKSFAEYEKLYAEAAACEPKDAMECLDVEAAKAEMEE